MDIIKIMLMCIYILFVSMVVDETMKIRDEIIELREERKKI